MFEQRYLRAVERKKENNEKLSLENPMDVPLSDIADIPSEELVQASKQAKNK